MSLIRYGLLFALVAFLLGISFVAADLYAKKVLGLGDPIVYDAHKLWGYSPRPNKSYNRFIDKKVSINNIGARGLDNWDKNGKNIVFFGDSVSYAGSYIDDDQTFISIACQSIKNWVCHNAGVNSYGILNMIARSRHDKRVNDAEFRVFTFVTGDFDRGLQTSNRAHFVLREPPAYMSGLWEILNFMAASIELKSWFGKNSDIKTSREEIYLNRMFNLEIFLTELERLKENNQKFLLIHSPSVTELENLDLINENEFFLILQNMYANNLISLSDILISPYRNKKKLLFKDNVHYEENGHLIVGKYLAPELLKLIKE